MEIGDAIKSIRKSKKIGQSDLAKSCDLSVNAISNIETNKTFPHKDTIKRICTALGVSTAFLLVSTLETKEIKNESDRKVFEILQSQLKKELK
jgi:transcriptional regulator with XRE-family HTH domain